MPELAGRRMKILHCRYERKQAGLEKIRRLLPELRLPPAIEQFREWHFGLPQRAPDITAIIKPIAAKITPEIPSRPFKLPRPF